MKTKVEVLERSSNGKIVYLVLKQDSDLITIESVEEAQTLIESLQRMIKAHLSDDEGSCYSEDDSIPVSPI